MAVKQPMWYATRYITTAVTDKERIENTDLSTPLRSRYSALVWLVDRALRDVLEAPETKNQVREAILSLTTNEDCKKAYAGELVYSMYKIDAG